jgi:hypothetical protein
MSIDLNGFVELGGGILSMTVIIPAQDKTYEDVKITFRDSCRLLQGSLDGLCKDLKPKY